MRRRGRLNGRRLGLESDDTYTCDAQLHTGYIADYYARDCSSDLEDLRPCEPLRALSDSP